MKLVLTKQPDNREHEWLPLFSDDLLRAWLRWNDIYVCENKYDDRIFELTYNYIYHFYDINMFPNREGREPTKYWKQIIDLFKKDGYKVEEASTFKWCNPHTPERKMISGVRIWIYPKE